MEGLKTVLDFGTSKVVCSAAYPDKSRGERIASQAIVNYDEFPPEHPDDRSAMGKAAQKALKITKSQLGQAIEQVYIVLPAGSIAVVEATAGIYVEGWVHREDMRAVVDKARDSFRSDDDQVIFTVPIGYWIDSESDLTLDVQELEARELHVRVALSVCSKAMVAQMEEIAKDLGVEISGYVPACLGQAMRLIPQEKRDGGAMLLDVGYYTSEISVVYADSVMFTAPVYSGGWDIVNELSVTLNISLDDAEALKRKAVMRTEGMSVEPQMTLPGPDGTTRYFETETVCGIIERWTEEIMHQSLMQVTSAGFLLGNEAPLVLTGGGLAPVRGMKPYLSEKLQRAVSMPIPGGAVLNTPMLTSTAGALHLQFHEFVPPEKKEKSGFFHKIFG